MQILRMSSTWTKALLLLAFIWLIAGAAIWWARDTKATPEALLSYVEKNPLDGQPPAERTRRIERTAKMLNSLDYDQRREMRVGRRLDSFFKSLTPSEQERFLDLTLPAGFQQMMDALNKMEPEKRKKFVDRAVSQMKRDIDRIPEGSELDNNARKIISEGVKSVYTGASAETKMDLAPLLEQLQHNLQGFR